MGEAHMTTLPSDERLRAVIAMLERRQLADGRPSVQEGYRDAILGLRTLIAVRALAEEWRGRAARYRQPDPATTPPAAARLREEADELDRRAMDVIAILGPKESPDGK